MIEITEHETAIRTDHWLVEWYKSGLRGVSFDTWIDKGYYLFHICIHRHNFKVQWWKGKK